jgi:hypothetical protein
MGYSRTVARFAVAGIALASPFIFPLSFTLVLALISGAASPLLPLTVGIMLDTLYWTHGGYSYPLYSLLGGIVTIAAFGVHRFAATSIMRA